MPQTIETTVFSFDELSDQAKERARDWWREASSYDEWWDCTYEDAKECGRLLGIAIDNICFSGFASQGDGACFEGSYFYHAGSVDAIKQHAPKDTRLHTIAESLLATQAQAFYGLSASVRQTGRYSHEYSTTIDVTHNKRNATESEQEAIAETLRDFMRWIYRQLEADYDWLSADEHVDENIRINEYAFTATGRRFGY